MHCGLPQNALLQRTAYEFAILQEKKSWSFGEIFNLRVFVTQRKQLRQHGQSKGDIMGKFKIILSESDVKEPILNTIDHYKERIKKTLE